MIKSPEKLADTTIQFSAPVKANSPELQQLFDFIALGASERDRILIGFGEKVKGFFFPFSPKPDKYCPHSFFPLLSALCFLILRRLS